MDTPQASKPDPLVAPDGDSPPLPPATAAGRSIEDQLAALQQQVAALLAIQQGTLQALAGATLVGTVKPSDEQLQSAAAAEPAPAARAMPRVRILLEDNESIPPGGQFIQVDGVPYLLQANMEADVPVNVLDVLDHAIVSVPVTDENRNVTGYRDRLRFPYRVIRDRTLIEQD